MCAGEEAIVACSTATNITVNYNAAGASVSVITDWPL
jgi:hypothetical protein